MFTIWKSTISRFASSMLCELLRVFFCCCLIPSLTHVIESVFQWMAKCITLNEFAILSKGIYGLLKIRAVYSIPFFFSCLSNLSAKLTPSQIPKKNKDFYDVLILLYRYGPDHVLLQIQANCVSENQKIMRIGKDFILFILNYLI